MKKKNRFEDVMDFVTGFYIGFGVTAIVSLLIVTLSK